MGFDAFRPGWMSNGLWATAAVVMVAAPVRAAELSTWSFDETQQQLEFSLPQSVQPRFFLLAEPTRVVLDIPATQLGPVPTEVTYAGAVERIRVSQFEGETVRIVIDLAPGTVLQERQADIEFEDIDGQRHWRFRPRVDAVATAAASAAAEPTPDLSAPSTSAIPPSADLTTDPSETAENISPTADHTAAVQPVPETQTARTEAPISLENAEEISFSAAGLQLPEQPAADASTLPIDLYAETSPPTATVSVPPIEPGPTADSAEPPTETRTAPERTTETAQATRPTRPSTPEPGYVPPMVAPELETPEIEATDVVAPTDTVATAEAGTAALPTVEPADTMTEPAPATAAPVEAEPVEAEPEELEPAPEVETRPTLATEAPLSETGPGADPPRMAAPVSEPYSVADTTVDPAIAAAEPTVAATPPFVETATDAAETTEAEADPYTAAVVPLEPLSNAADAASFPTAIPEVEPVAVVDIAPDSERTITDTRSSTPIYFGQPLPSD
ncbi:MAG: AMIN domain-containing protein [Cyanobacteria bacterium P01_D01_bin.14]